jgi:hypothetical protein
MTDKLRAEWTALLQEADECAGQLIPKCAAMWTPAPNGYRAQMCAKQFPVYRGLFEVKAKAVIWNTKTQEVQYESHWASVDGTQRRLQKALEVLSEIVAYREAMEAKTKPVGDSTSLF